MSKPQKGKGFNRKHLIVMGIGNIIGSGIFLASGTVISVAGPATPLLYALGGLLMFFEVMCIAEMSIINPAPGSFRVHAAEVFGRWIGFTNGWLFWVSGVLGMAGEVTAASIYISHWFPHIPLWVFCLAFTVIMTIINLNDIRGLSRVEAWLASVKVIALTAFIMYGFLSLFHIIPDVALQPSQAFSPFLPHGWQGAFAPLILVLFSFTGTGIIGLAIAESEDPATEVPPAIFTITFIVTCMYVLAITFIILLTPWDSLSSNQSPFVQILERTGLRFGGELLNIIVLSASLSGMNTAMYSASRMLFSLGKDGQGPAILAKKTKKEVPVYALGVSSIILTLTAVLSYLLPDKIFIILVGASSFTAMLNWLTIFTTHILYRRKTLREKPEKLKFKVPGYPFTSILAILLILLVLASTAYYPTQWGGLAGAFLLFFAFIGLYFVLKKMNKIK